MRDLERRLGRLERAAGGPDGLTVLLVYADANGPTSGRLLEWDQAPDLHRTARLDEEPRGPRTTELSAEAVARYMTAHGMQPEPRNPRWLGALWDPDDA